ncbi:MAG TPA: hypothetical protein VGM90_40455 [Kofleriaceae bacterium]
MKLAVALAASVAVGGVAHADCRVNFIAAPDYVRDEIEAYLEREPRCGPPLDVSVSESSDGQLSLRAVRIDGRVHQRIVPSAAVAGALVASWVADEGTEEPREARVAESSSWWSDIPADVDRRGAPPGGHWLSLGATIGLPANSSVRADGDLIAGKIFSIGLSGSVRREEFYGADVSALDFTTYLLMPRVGAKVHVAKSSFVQGWVAYGVGYAHPVAGYHWPSDSMITEPTANWGHAGEVGFVGGVDMSKRFAFSFGFVVTSSSIHVAAKDWSDRHTAGGFYLGVSCRL